MRKIAVMQLRRTNLGIGVSELDSDVADEFVLETDSHDT